MTERQDEGQKGVQRGGRVKERVWKREEVSEAQGKGRGWLCSG